MSVLVDWQIKALSQQEDYKLLDPFSDAVSGNGTISYGVSHAGYDLRLADEFVFLGTHRGWDRKIDPKRMKDVAYLVDVTEKISTSQPVEIPANSSVLCRSVEYIRMPRNCIGICLGKSTYARCGIIANTTPLEPGWEGHLVIELSNLNPIPAVIYPGEGIAQVVFFELSAQPTCSYKDKNGKYEGQTGVTLAKVI